jgi:hypothetical protein
VDAHGRRHGSYRTISEAIVDANPGDYINVCEGIYEEELHIDKPVQITGEGGDPVTLLVTVKLSAGTPVSFDAEAGVLKHLRFVALSVCPRPCLSVLGMLAHSLACSHTHRVPTFALLRAVSINRIIQEQSADDDTERCAVDVRRGHLELFGCTVSSQSTTGACILVRDGANPRIVESSILDGLNVGVRVCGNSAAEIICNTISGHASHGVEVYDGAYPHMRANTVKKNMGSGLHFRDWYVEN